MTDEEREEDVLLFEEIEFPVFLEYAAIFAPAEKVLAGLHFANQFGLGGGRYKGWTPMEIAWTIYNFWDMEQGTRALVNNTVYRNGRLRKVDEMLVETTYESSVY